MIKAVIFDFDDTLSMTSGSNNMLTNKALVAMGREPMSMEEHQKTVGDPLKVTLANHYPGLDLEEFMLHLNKERGAELAKGQIENVSPEGLNAMDELARQGKQLMIVSSRREEGFWNLMDRTHHLGSRISHFYHMGNNPYHKPDPRVFEIIEKEHGLKPSECVYVGDTLNDAAAATGAGLHFIASLESGILSQKDYADYKVDAFVKNIPGILPAIAALEKN